MEIPGLELPPAHMTIKCRKAGLGDLIARIPAIRWMHENHEHISMTILWQDFYVDLANILLPPEQYPRLKHTTLSGQRVRAAPGPVVDFATDRISTLSLGLVEHAFLILMDRLPPTPQACLYPAPGPQKVNQYIPGDYVVFTPGYTAPARRWPAVFVNALARRVRSAGLTPVLLGTSDVKKLDTGEGIIKAGLDQEVDRSLFVDLWDKTTLPEALGIMQWAEAVVGVDNGLLHLASCTDVPIVYGLTTLEESLRVPLRAAGKTVVLNAQVPCAGCQSRSFGVNTDWRYCPSQRMSYACTLTMTDSRFASALRELGVIVS